MEFDKKTLHEQFVTGLTGSSISDIYTVIAICILGFLTSTTVTTSLAPTNKFGQAITDLIYNWLCVLVGVTIYSNQLLTLVAVLFATALMAIFTIFEERGREATESKKTEVSKDKQANVEAKPAKKEVKKAAKKPSGPVVEGNTAQRDFLTVYRSTMMVLTMIAILAVDFPIFPRRFAKAETWGTSLMDLGVGSFVFSMGVVSSRRSLKFPNSTLIQDMKHALKETTNLLILGVIRLASLKYLDYQEHVTEYGVHWNFFFTLGLLPCTFSIVKRIPPKSRLLTAIITAFSYELLLKNTGLMEWALAAPRTNLISQNKEGITSFMGYMAIFAFGNALGFKVLNKNESMKKIIIRCFVWAITAHGVLHVLRIATEPSRRLANLPYIFWCVSFNAGLIGIFALFEYLINAKPTTSLVHINKYGNVMFVFSNVLTGLINIKINTIEQSEVTSLAILVGYIVVLFLVARFLNRLF